MLELSESNIHLNAKATNKLQAIEMAASALEQAGNVEQGYLQGMLGREQQTSTFLGNGIAIPHGTLETRSMVKKTGVQVFQFPQGIEWGEGNYMEPDMRYGHGYIEASRKAVDKFFTAFIFSFL